MQPASHPVLTCGEALSFEESLFGGDEAAEWAAMERAGRAVGTSAIQDFNEIGGFPENGSVLVLSGKGHNGGDAMLAAQEILERFPGARADIVLVFGERVLRPLALRAYRQLVHGCAGRVSVSAAPDFASRYDLSLDGVFGFQFKPPVAAAAASLIKRVNALSIRLRAAVDLPSGLGGMAVLKADFTYATGSVKDMVVDRKCAANVGRLRYLDLGFFDRTNPESASRVLGNAVLDGLRGLRSGESDKRTFGHLLVVGGSRSYPGAVLMTVLSALRSGVGLVTAFVPGSLAPAFAARAPEAMWVGWPETPAGGLALEGRHLLLERLERAAALAIGPGLGTEPETLALIRDIVAEAKLPLVLDADALQSDIVRAGSAPRVLTPHAGEYRRIQAGGDFDKTPATENAVFVLKGGLTRIAAGHTEYYCPFGGPVLARGGSGDLLTGLIGGLLAQAPGDPLLAACRGVVWHGRAADLLAQAHGQVAVNTTQLLDFLSPALRA